MEIIEGAVYIEAVDWGVCSEQVAAGYSMPIVRGGVIGIVVDEDDDRMVLAQQIFDDGGMRALLSIPKVCISRRLALQVKE